MSAPWIKICTDLHERPEVAAMAAALSRHQFDIVGRLVRLWGWVNVQSHDGTVPGISAAWIDQMTACDGFAQAMTDVGWLKITRTGIVIPKFDRHNGASAKKRAMDAARQAASRSCHGRGVTESRPDESETETERKIPDKSLRDRVHNLNGSASIQDARADGPSASGSTARNKARFQWERTTAPLIGRAGKGRHPPDTPQHRADVTSVGNMFDQIWPDDMPDDEGQRRADEAIALAKTANRNGQRPMAYLTRLLSERLAGPSLAPP